MKPIILNHPVLKHKLRILRDKNTPSNEFRLVLSEASALMAYEATKDIELEEVTVDTPFEKAKCFHVVDKILIANIFRAGLGMLDGFLKALPFASVGHIGIYRDKQLNNTIEYYFKLPNHCEGAKVFLIDPLLATGDTALAAIDRLKEYGVGPIKLITILSSPQGIKKVNEEHKDVQIYTLSIDRELNKQGYILPGLGDAGDRIFGTSTWTQ